MLGTFSQEPQGGSALGQSEVAGAAALLSSTCKGHRRGVSQLRLDTSSSVHPRPLWTPSAVPLLILPPQVLEPLESSSKLYWFLVKVPPFFVPKIQKHFFFSFSSLEGGAEEVPDLLLFSPAPPWGRGGGVLGRRGVPGAGPLCFTVVFLEQVAIFMQCCDACAPETRQH